LNEGVQVASEHQPDFLWFTDADIEHAPDTLHAWSFARKEIRSISFLDGAASGRDFFRNAC